MIRRRFAIAAFLVALFVLGWWVGRGRATGRDLYSNVDQFIEVLQRVRSSYVDQVESDSLMKGALEGLTRGLDPYSQYLDRRSYEDLQATTHGEYGGVGLVVGIRDELPVVISPIEGGPAWTLGLQTGDLIVRVEGANTMGLGLEAVAQRLRGEPGTHVQISVRREGESDDREFAIERRVITTRSVPYAFIAAPRIGYVRLSDFSEDAGGEVRLALDRLHREGATRLVLDLRGNPGGLLDQAVDVAEQFVKAGTPLVSTHGRMKGSDTTHPATGQRPELAWPMVVLIDRGSASASEIVAGALQDLDRALVIGETSFGKGLVQSVFPLRGGGALKLTTARYYTPSGRSINSAASERLLDSLLALGDDAVFGDDAPARPVVADSTPAEMFRTASGRPVYGGGGIRPDVTVTADTLRGLARRVESRGLAFRFANVWVTRHPEWKFGHPLDDEVRA
ncbi:MAG: S41 family peptidase, partial [Candidatus Eisenbacteria bacterium]|nr:S41 family peptidase [Candidatus Eisenbacteria bacterium]